MSSSCNTTSGSAVSLYVDQATSHTIIVDAIHQDGKVFQLDDFSVFFSTKHYDLPCEVSGGTVTVVLTPEHTDIDSTGYQIRAFKGGEIYQIMQGRLTVSKATVKAYKEPPQ